MVFLPGFAALTLTRISDALGVVGVRFEELVVQYEYWSNAKAALNATRMPIRIMTAVYRIAYY